MKSLPFGTRCPICAGPAVRAGGSERCVICGHGVQLAVVRRPQRAALGLRLHRPRQLMLPFGSLDYRGGELR